MQRGTKPLTVAQINLRGNSRHLTSAQLKAREAEESRDTTPADYVPSGKPKMPNSVKEIPEAVEAWKGAVKILKERGALTRGDGPALTVFALCQARYLKATADVEKRGFEIEVERGDKKGERYTTSTPNPSLQIISQCERQLLALAVRLGMTPKDRSGIRPAKPKTPKPKPNDESILDAYLRKEGLA